MKREDKVQMIIQLKEEINELIHEKYHELAKKYDLSLEQFHLLIELEELMLDVNNEFKAPTVGQIAKNINNSQNTVSERITRLENKGLVSRIKDIDDKRISRVILTDKGRKLIESIENEASSKYLFNSISSMEDIYIDSLLKNLEKLVEQMNIIK
ncbi:MarR family transcriptional regulator [Clostridium beijerinckii]|uniref:MarR family transcriptional regulator n=1 Tax=Clostridium beijerinckii TaxID=1520 RepID=UPI001360CFE5|nr:MarR family transcriptional regulator [Clostridium beijerinckii]MZK53531.1 MarR family transcriptional regulator [Clostridium beijerinckii]MZK60445.1 MarR family transcriptional regulator [Clostridium beijerinckii]MZK70262.1 MarR family transcriptional regulator [Clostridium beijerinckii]MZK76068.1 MarR family transcriptional regulator [Clostridium beijerinckii]MZK85173.1 MarR family transcriptional regulator [Clostridium beijerinckii]